jgi:choice-of-anchor A domain-containing protein
VKILGLKGGGSRLALAAALMWSGMSMLGARVSSADSIFNYNIVVTNTLTIGPDDEQGPVFVNNLITNGQPVFASSSSSGHGDTLNVAGTITLGATGDGITLNNGTFVHHFALPSGMTVNLNGNRPDITDPSLSIVALSNQMGFLANVYSGKSANATASLSGNNLNLNPTGTGLSVYDITSSTLGASNLNVSINLANSTQAVLIEVSGSSFTFGSSEHINISGGTGEDQVLWFFPNATTISLQDPWEGSILATNASLSTTSQDITGGVYVKNFNESAEVHLPVVNSPLLTNVPEPGSVGLLSLMGLLFRRPRRK